ncbi:ComF family protein [Caulobacter segnis]
MFARWAVAGGGRPAGNSADAVVPVPVHRARPPRRRYNQAAEIARPLARLAGLDYLPGRPGSGNATPPARAGVGLRPAAQRGGRLRRARGAAAPRSPGGGSFSSMTC